MAVADFSPFHLFTFSLLLGWLLDLLIGDPSWLPHPVVGFGKVIAFGERHLNKGSHRKLKGALLAVSLIAATYGLTLILLECLSFCRNDVMTLLREILCALVVFYCLAGTTLIREVREVFLALDRSLDEGRKQVARIVGRDTSELSAQEVRTAALETLAENLSDGVIAPLVHAAGSTRHVGVQDGEHARLHDWLPNRPLSRLRLLGCSHRRHRQLHSSPSHSPADDCQPPPQSKARR